MTSIKAKTFSINSMISHIINEGHPLPPKKLLKLFFFCPPLKLKKKPFNTPWNSMETLHLSGPKQQPHSSVNAADNHLLLLSSTP